MTAQQKNETSPKTLHPTNQSTNAPNVQQPLTIIKLQTHRLAAHNIRHPLRKLATTPTCPLCMTTYKNLRTCQEHISKVCGPRATAQTIRQLTLQVDTAFQLQAQPNYEHTNTPTANIKVILSRVATTATNSRQHEKATLPTRPAPR